MKEKKYNYSSSKELCNIILNETMVLRDFLTSIENDYPNNKELLSIPEREKAMELFKEIEKLDKQILKTNLVLRSIGGIKLS